MDDQKLEPSLNLALDASPEELERSLSLSQGFNPEDQSWELIIRYTGSLQFLKDMGIQVDELTDQYAIITAPQSLIPLIGKMPQITYIEKPKRLFFAVYQAKAASCINILQSGRESGAKTGAADGGRLNLSGRGVIVGIIDSGIDYYHMDFRNLDGTTRILKLWDQTLDHIFDQKELNQALEAGSREAARALVPSFDGSGHGTAVAGIAAGNGLGGELQNRGVAYESPLLIVKLGIPDQEGFPRTTELMRAIDFMVKQAEQYGMPIAINLSFGNTYGSHDGTSLLETYIDDMALYGRSVIAVGTGNEGAAGGHTSGYLEMGTTQEIPFTIAEYETGLSIQLWKYYEDEFTIELVSPAGTVLGPVSQSLGAQILTFAGTTILLYYGIPAPYSTAQEIYMEFIPTGDYLDSGIWMLRLHPQNIVTGAFDLWLPSAGVLNPSTRFLYPTPDRTLTIPSTAARVVAVGAYDSSYRSYAPFSGRGFTRTTNQIKPDLAAPGVNILTARAGGGYDRVTGTSFATPFVAGSAALMMEWGIVDGNDPYLYGQKVKAYLRRGARQLPGYEQWPNAELGYGVLCLSESLPLY